MCIILEQQDYEDNLADLPQLVLFTSSYLSKDVSSQVYFPLP